MLRPFTPEDEDTVVSFLTCPQFMVYSPTGALNVRGAKQRFSEITFSYERNGFGKLAIVVKASGVLIGYCGIEMCEIDGVSKAELGFRLKTNYRGMGYATEASKAVLEYSELILKDDIIAFTEQANQPSMKVLAKLGFKRTGESSVNGMAVILFGRGI